MMKRVAVTGAGDQGGQALVLVMLSMVTVVGFVLLSTAVGRLVIEKICLQNAADLSAFSGAAAQARGMNKLAEMNRDNSKRIQDWIDHKRKFDNADDARDYFEPQIKDMGRSLKNKSREAALDAAAKAGEVAARNYSGAVKVFQVGVQKVKDDGHPWKLHPYLARFRFESIRLPYIDNNKGGTKYVDIDAFPYYTLGTHVFFWSRLRAEAPKLTLLAGMAVPPLPVFEADSMAMPAGGDLGRQSGASISGIRQTYEVQFARIGHPKLEVYNKDHGYFAVPIGRRGIESYYPSGVVSSPPNASDVVSNDQRLAYEH